MVAPLNVGVNVSVFVPEPEAIVTAPVWLAVNVNELMLKLASSVVAFAVAPARSDENTTGSPVIGTPMSQLLDVFQLPPLVTFHFGSIGLDAGFGLGVGVGFGLPPLPQPVEVVES